MMIIERTFEVQVETALLSRRMEAHLKSLGFVQATGQPLTFERGSTQGSTKSGDPRQWRSVLKVNLNPADSGFTQVRAVLEVDDSFQVVEPPARATLEAELDGLLPAMNAERAQVPLSPQLTMEAQLQQQVGGRANWFYWIAGLSVVNTILSMTGSSRMFLFGLGTTSFIDAVVALLAEDMTLQEATTAKWIGFGITVVISLFLVALGALSRRHRWVYMLGMVLYLADGVLTLLAGLYLAAAFHLYVLIYLFRGWQAMGKLEKIKTAAV